ncbi:class C sortase [Helcococcus kunzii]|uniref:class C sortase n=1 Tax=Helcococcus kunzii TaxID=40091 RepID=UPI0024AC99B2|nr:class C sortase [Helcococcus kunzii]
MKKSLKKFAPLLLFLVEGLIALYPLISQKYYEVESSNQIIDYINEVDVMEQKEIDRRLRLAKIYNGILDITKLADPYSKEEKEEAVTEYANMLKVQEKIGFIEIPKINQNLPIYAGTKESILEKGVGHLEGTSLPIGGESTHTVLTAHRGLPTAKLFTDLDKMEKGDVFYIHSLNNVLAYEVDQILTVEPTNFDPVLVVEGKDYATLLTCTPYMVNSHRLLVRGRRIDYTPPAKESIIEKAKSKTNYEIYLYIALAFILILLILIYLTRKKIKTINTSEK